MNIVFDQDAFKDFTYWATEEKNFINDLLA